MMSNFHKIYYLFLSQNQFQIVMLLIALLGMAAMQTLGVASILPFVAVLVNPETIETNRYLAYSYKFIGLNNQNNFLLFLGTCTLAVLILSNMISALAIRSMIKFITMQEHLLSQKLFEKYLHKPYTFFLSRNSSELTKNIITEVSRSVSGVLKPFLDIIARFLIVITIISLLLLVDPVLAILVLMVCGGSYLLVYNIFQAKLIANGNKSVMVMSERYKIINEAFGGIKDIKLLGKEKKYFQCYEIPSFNYAKCETIRQSITDLPKYALETIIFGGILLILLYLIGLKQDMGKILPFLALYTFAGYRLMPALQRAFAQLTTLRFHIPGLERIYQDMQNLDQKILPHSVNVQNQALRFNHSISLQNVSYCYPESRVNVLKNINLTIQANTTIGFVGSTGSGKTTLIDIILGLLALCEGEMFVDDIKINQNNIRNWQNKIGYVPQNIFLADDTITQNIALGETDNDIDFEGIKHAAQIANIDEFITNDLPNGYNTQVGERGVKLSGGQRQRIGIARAIYHKPKLLVLDEATSALDGISEETVMSAINNLSGKKTIILIAHRLTTIKQCDLIHIIKDGRILASGNYEDLLKSCDYFRKMAQSHFKL